MFYRNNIFLSLLLLCSSDACAGLHQAVDAIRTQLKDPCVYTVLQMAFMFVPLIAQKYDFFQSAETLDALRVTRKQVALNNHQINETNNKKIEKMAIENAQERLATVYRSQEQLEHYRLYKDSIPNEPAYRAQKAEAELIYAGLIVDYGKFFQKVLEKNREAVGKIDEEYAAYVSQNNAKNA